LSKTIDVPETFVKRTWCCFCN